MLAKANRVTRGADYRAIVRRGRRLSGPNTIAYIRRNPEGFRAVRFGFIVGKNVGGSVDRNTVRRRLKAACYELLPATATGSDVVVRALPASRDASWATLLEEISRAVSKGSSTS